MTRGTHSLISSLFHLLYFLYSLISLTPALFEPKPPPPDQISEGEKGEKGEKRGGKTKERGEWVPCATWMPHQHVTIILTSLTTLTV